MFQALSNVHQTKTVKATAAMLVATFIGVVTVQADDKKIEVTIKNKTNVLITVKFNDAANKQFSPEVKANDVVKCSVDPMAGVYKIQLRKLREQHPLDLRFDANP